MNVYLVQHAEAKSKEIDPSRQLSDQGAADAQRVAALAGMLGIPLAQIRHSGKLRASQTAAIFDRALHPAGSVVEQSGLSPLDDVEPIADSISSSTEPLMFVGHLPFLSRLTSKLIVGDSTKPIVSFQNAALVCLVSGEEGWQVSWILTPHIAAAAGT
jgi:phosphohistidine phosphatase